MSAPANPEATRYELRASPEQIQRWREAAGRLGLPLAAWVRLVLDKQAESKAEQALPNLAQQLHDIRELRKLFAQPAPAEPRFIVVGIPGRGLASSGDK